MPNTFLEIHFGASGYEMFRMTIPRGRGEKRGGDSQPHVIVEISQNIGNNVEIL